MTNKEIRQAADDGDIEAQYTLGSMYFEGIRGLPQNYAKAHHWLLKAAKRGHANAQFVLGNLYALGKSKDVPQDYSQSRYWLKKAAAKGHTDAQYTLGFIYLRGEGIRPNIDTAREWFRRACDNGDQRGCKLYAELTETLEQAGLLTPEAGPKIDV